MTFYVILALLAWAMVMILTFALMIGAEQRRIQRERERDRIEAQLAGWRTAHHFGKRGL